MSRPRVLITLDTGAATRRGVSFPTVHQKAAYGRAVLEAGGLPVWVAPAADAAEALLAIADGLVLTGGPVDLDPALYGAPRTSRRLDAPKPERASFELALLRGALALDLPVLGVCGGMQLMAVAAGGTLVQDIAEASPEALEHEQPTSPAAPWHEVRVRPSSPLQAIVGHSTLAVNSTHHQAVADAGALEVWGEAPDGIVEAIGDASGRRVGVEWHPELLDDAPSRALYAHLVELSRERALPRGRGAV